MFLVHLETAKLSSQLGAVVNSTDKRNTDRITVGEWLTRRLALSRLAHEMRQQTKLVFGLHSESRGELHRADKVIKYAVEDWAVFGFQGRSLQSILKEYACCYPEMSFSSWLRSRLLKNWPRKLRNTWLELNLSSLCMITKNSEITN